MLEYFHQATVQMWSADDPQAASTHLAGEMNARWINQLRSITQPDPTLRLRGRRDEFLICQLEWPSSLSPDLQDLEEQFNKN